MHDLVNGSKKLLKNKIGEIIPSKEIKFPPYKLKFLTVQERLQGGNRSTELEKETGAQLDYKTFSSEGRHHHNPLGNQMPCTSHCRIRI